MGPGGSPIIDRHLTPCRRLFEEIEILKLRSWTIIKEGLLTFKRKLEVVCHKFLSSLWTVEKINNSVEI